MSSSIVTLAERMNQLASMFRELEPTASLLERCVSHEGVVTCLNKAREDLSKIESEMVLLQEEIDWIRYWGYGLCEESYLGDMEAWRHVDVKAGQRPFEIISGMSQDDFLVPNDVPTHWPNNMRLLWFKRMRAIKEIPGAGVIEDPHYKRRWIGRQGLFNHAARSDELRDACKGWLLARLEKLTVSGIANLCANLGSSQK